MKLLKQKDKFFYLAILTFVFISTSALSLSRIGPVVVEEVLSLTKKTKAYVPVPVLSESTTFPTLSAQAALAVDVSSGISLYEKNPDSELLPASTTKIVTALVSLDAYLPDSILKVGRVNVVGQKMGLYMGEEMRAEDLLYGLLVYSANDAAEVLAQNYPGGRDAFLVAMNEKALSLSMNSSRFVNPAGLDGNKTTARDLARVSEVAMKIPEFAKIVSTKNIIVKDISGRRSHRLSNINELLGSVPGVIGIKTGWTENARENLVTYIERDGRKVMIVILGSQDRFGETRELIDWVFENYKWEEVSPPKHE